MARPAPHFRPVGAWSGRERGSARFPALHLRRIRISTGFAPPNDLESAILATLTNGNYAAIVSGKNGATGVGLVEVYKVAVAVNQ